MKNFIALLIMTLYAFTGFGASTTPLNRAFLQSNMNGNGKSITNLAEVVSALFTGDATGLSNVTATAVVGDLPWESITNIEQIQIPAAAITNNPWQYGGSDLTNWATLSTNVLSTLGQTNISFTAVTNAPWITDTNLLNGTNVAGTITNNSLGNSATATFVTTSPLTNDVYNNRIVVTNGINFPAMTVSNVPIQMTSGVLAPDSMLTNGLNIGALEFGSPTNGHTFYATTFKVRRSIVLAQSVLLNDVTVSNTVTAGGVSNLLTVTMAANYLTVGKTIEPNLDGVYWQNAAGGTFAVIQAWNNTTNLLLTVPMVGNQAATAAPWEIRFRFTCRTNTAAANSMALIGRATEVQAATSGGAATTAIDAAITPTVIDPTILNTITITISNNVAGGQCSYRLQQARTLCIDSVPKLPGE